MLKRVTAPSYAPLNLQLYPSLPYFSEFSGRSQVSPPFFLDKSTTHEFYS
jgi:hypothetical protein